MSQLLNATDSVSPGRRLHGRRGLVIHLILAAVPTAAAGEMPRPVAVWPSGPLEAIAAFETPLDPTSARRMIGRTIPYKDIRPDRPDAEPSGRLRIVGARLADDGRTLILATDPHPRPARYLLPLPGEQTATVPYDLSGIEAAWSEGEQTATGTNWSGWWPSPDLETSKQLTRGSRPHEACWRLIARPGRLKLSAWVYLPKGKATFRVQSTGAIEEATLGDAMADANEAGADGLHRIAMSVESRAEPLFFTMTVRTGVTQKPLSIGASFGMAGVSSDHPVGRDRVLLPWAPVSDSVATPAPVAIPDLSGGDPERGRTIFLGDQSRCSQCHAFRGEGGKVGPDLTGIAEKGKAHIYRSIAAPSAEIAPDYTTYAVATTDGQVLSGVVRAEGPETIQVTDTNARTTTVRRDRIQEIRPSATSIMPPGMAAALGESAVRDLIAYLTAR